MEIAPGAPTGFQVRIVRGFFEGDVRIELLDRPRRRGESGAGARVRERGAVEVRAKEGAGPGERVLKVVASADTQTGTVRPRGRCFWRAAASPAADPVLKLSVRNGSRWNGAGRPRSRCGSDVGTSQTCDGDDEPGARRGDSAAGLSSDPIQLTPGTDVGVLEVRAERTRELEFRPCG